MRKLIREAIFRLIRHDLVNVIEEHKEELVAIFRDEMERLDDRIPEEDVFIDIKMAPLGEEMMRAALTTVTRFIKEIYT